MFLPGLVLSICIFGVILVRRCSPQLRIGTDIAALLAISLILWANAASPLLLSIPQTTASEELLFRGAAIAWWLFACRCAVSLMRAVMGHDKRSRETRLFSDLFAAGIYISATLTLLDLVFKVPVGGLLATSGLIAIVVGLALQNTLADVFAGIAVGIERPFSVGDRIRLSDGIEGRVEQMNWRSIRLRTDQNDLAVIPNSSIAKAEIVNRSSPTERGTVRADLTTPADADPDRVFELLRAAAMLTPDALTDPAPITLLLRVGERTSSYAIIFTVSDTGHALRARSELLRHARKQMATTGMVPGTSEACGGRLLREATLFESLCRDRLATLEDALRLRQLIAGETMFEQNTTEPVLYLIAGGVIEISRRLGPEWETLGRIGAGEYIGEICLLTGAPRTVRAVALTDARIYTLHKSALEPMLDGNEALLQAFERSVRRGQSLLSRNPAASQIEEISGPSEMIARMLKFFRR